MHLVCPHCYNPVELDELPSSGEIVCSSCGSSFRLEDKSTTIWNSQTGQRSLGKFEIIGTLGVGAFGTVYKARDTELDRVVAVKEIGRASCRERVCVWGVR